MADKTGLRSIVSKREYIRYIDLFTRGTGNLFPNGVGLSGDAEEFLEKAEAFTFRPSEVLRYWRIWRSDLAPPLSFELVRFQLAGDTFDRGSVVIGRANAWVCSHGAVFYGYGPVSYWLHSKAYGQTGALQRERLEFGIPEDVERSWVASGSYFGPCDCKRPQRREMAGSGEVGVVPDVFEAVWEDAALGPIPGREDSNRTWY